MRIWEYVMAHRAGNAECSIGQIWSESISCAVVRRRLQSAPHRSNPSPEPPPAVCSGEGARSRPVV